MDTMYTFATFAWPFSDSLLSAHFWVLATSSQFFSTCRSGPNHIPSNYTGPSIQRPTTILGGIDLLLKMPICKPSTHFHIKCFSRYLIFLLWCADQLDFWDVWHYQSDDIRIRQHVPIRAGCPEQLRFHSKSSSVNTYKRERREHFDRPIGSLKLWPPIRCALQRSNSWRLSRSHPLKDSM